ncbi:hypothetical protein MTP99_012618 [Tenebrio molitor]|nr:hypothetical protein MTP99_012618 [Tenebrio molitor]
MTGKTKEEKEREHTKALRYIGAEFLHSGPRTPRSPQDPRGPSRSPTTTKDPQPPQKHQGSPQDTNIFPSLN